PSVRGDRCGGGDAGGGDPAGRDLERADPVHGGGHALPGVVQGDQVAGAVLPDAFEQLDVLGEVALRDPGAGVHLVEQRGEVLDTEIRGQVPGAYLGVEDLSALFDEVNASAR